ncbi:MAG: hypothetical protein AB1813_09865 [Verrucomicrobiota bacterium]
MKRAQLIRIVLLLLIIFAAGFFVGRLTSPRSAIGAAASAFPSTPAESMIGRLALQVGITPEQHALMEPIAAELAAELLKAPPDSIERVEIFRKYVPKLRSCLRPDQFHRFDRAVAKAESRFRERVNNRHQKTD